MKIAVCIFGQPRFFKEAAESFRKEFLDMPNHKVDVFIHCVHVKLYTILWFAVLEYHDLLIVYNHCMLICCS